MGVVHLAVDPQGRQVAVKVLRSEVAGDEVARRRLSREVETMRRVRSTYIAEVVDADVTGHRPYIVTRYVPGRALDEIIKDEGPLDLPALVRIAHGVASALASVHAGGVIHRDLKPGNVLIIDGEPVLIDFGIAQAVDATRLTQTGMFIGTPGFLAPEIIEGQEAGPEVDIHAWAGTLLYAATGQPPFGKGTLEMIFYNITAGKADIGAAPAPLQPLLKAAFQRNPAKRPKAAELAEKTARMLPKSFGNVPDEISTVPQADPRLGADLPEPAPIDSRPAYEISTPPVTPRALIEGERARLAPPLGQPPQAQPYSLLGKQTPGLPDGPASGLDTSGQGGEGIAPPQDQPHASSPPDEGDPWPTRRVTPEELRRMQQESGPQQPWQAGRQSGGHAGPASGYASQGGEHGGYAAPHVGHQAPAQAVPYDGDVPTRRVRPDTPDYGRPSSSSHAMPGPAPHGHAHGPQPHAHGPGPNPGPVPQPRPVQQPPPPYIPAQPQYPVDPQTRREPYVPGALPGQALRRSKAYGVASAMLLVVMVVTAVMAPILVAVVALPVAVLLRAADLAQRELSATRSTGSAALDVVRVLGRPAALAKSVGITLALTLYALILGLPVTLLLTVVLGTNPYNALAWGAAVALWTVCAGPGVEGPGRQMRRTLASLVPSRTAAMVLAGVLAAGAALSLLLAYGMFASDARRSVWTPLDVAPVVERLDSLKGDSGG